MSARGKGRRSAKHKRTDKYKNQFYRTVKRTGKWRGVLADLYKKYVKKRKSNVKLGDK
jgi:hypothetical protein